MDRAARIAVREIGAFLERSQVVQRAVMVCFGEAALPVHRLALRNYLAAAPEGH